MFYILENRIPIPTDYIHQWGEMFEDIDGRRIGLETVGDVTVSTVFMGLDHGFGNDIPRLFETLIDGGSFDSIMVRHPTWETAEAGHEMALKVAQGELELDDLFVRIYGA